MRLAATMPDQPPAPTPRARAALALGQIAHALFRLIIAAVLLGIPVLLLGLLWSWLRG